MQEKNLNEQEKLTDLLSSQKYLTGVYNSFCNEASTGVIRSCLSSILQDEHRIGEELFQEMNTRGWYRTEAAEEPKINAAKQKFSASVSH